MRNRHSLLRRSGLAVLLSAASGMPGSLRAAASAATSDAIVGDWMVESHDAGIRISAVGEGADRHYDGHIVWLKEARYGASDGPELAGKPVTDRKNPDSSKRDRPLLGLPLLWDLRYQNGKWDGGRIYNSDDGHTYRCTVHLKDPDHLRLHGFVGVELLGGNTLWTRVTGFPPPADPSP
jgi:uncharacterized protein (DUF2147 family)